MASHRPKAVHQLTSAQFDDMLPGRQRRRLHRLIWSRGVRRKASNVRAAAKRQMTMRSLLATPIRSASNAP